MISERDQYRIANDAYTAMDAIEAIKIGGLEGWLTEDYIKEKLGVVRSCVEFIEHFEEKRA